VMEAQARQAELANPSAFIQKYGADVISQQVGPLKQQLEDLARQNQQLQQQFQNSMPRPDRDWIGQNRDKLYAKDARGQEVETPVGAIYRSAWNAAAEQGKSIADIHQYALGVITPLIGAQPQAQQPRQSWMAGVQNPQSNMYAADPSFTAPGTIFNNGVSPQHQGRPLGNDGFPTFAAIHAQGIQ
jgi:ABC-type phosphate transport system auxiliary subunit